ncbi:MAG TPA: hypothetical protein VGB89_14125 [Bacteroidota bacterium]|jgi:MSHA pilin protein MshD
MNLGQMMLVLLALILLGNLVLNSNGTIIETTDVINTSEIDIAAVSIATSLVEEATGKLFDEAITLPAYTALTDVTQLSTTLAKDGGEKYRDTTAAFEDFDDVDDFNGLFIVYKSDLPSDSVATPGADWEFKVKDIRAKYFVRTKVVYVEATNLDGVSSVRTWHKKLTVTVTSPTSKDTLNFPAIMSYWN